MSGATDNDRAREFADDLRAMGPITVSRFFGGASLVKAGVQFGFVIMGSLYLRVDDTSRAAFEALGARPFSYAGKSKTVTVGSYYEAPDEVIENPEDLARWASEAHRVATCSKATTKRGERAPHKEASLISGDLSRA
jgi:DNA transformation protein and related proteins